MHPTLVSFIGLLSFIDAAVISTSSSSSSNSSTTISTRTFSSVPSSTLTVTPLSTSTTLLVSSSSTLSSTASSSSLVSTTAGGRPGFHLPALSQSSLVTSAADASITTSNTPSSRTTVPAVATTSSAAISASSESPSSTATASSSLAGEPDAVVAAAGRPGFTLVTPTTVAKRPGFVVQSVTPKVSTTAKPTTSTSTAKPTTPTSTSTTTSSSTTSSSTTSSSSSTTLATTTKSSTTMQKVTSTSSIAHAASSSACFADYYPAYRVLNGSSTTSSSMTPNFCSTYCSSLGYQVSATEYADECYCSHVAPVATSAGCNMACAGDATKLCGGSNALNVVVSTATLAAATSSSKRGLCWPYNNAASTFNLFSPSQETWVYNWEMWTPLAGTSFASAQYVGLVRDPSRLTQISWYYTSSSRASPYLLGFNEPDLTGDTYVTVADAVTYWQQYFLPLRKTYGTILGAPAVTNAVQANWGIDWLNQFNAACVDTTTSPGTSRSCFDLIPIHWYGYYLSDFQNYIANFHSVYPSYPIWVTEFAFTGHPASEVESLTRGALQWLDAQPYVQRYSMFGPMNAANMAGITGAAMVSDDLSSLTNTGKIYNGQL